MAEGAPRGNSDLHCRRATCWYGIFLSRQLRAAFSGGEIHSLGRLRLEGFPESLSRTWELVHRNVGFGLRGICHASKRLSCSVSLSLPWEPLLPIHGRVTNMIQQIHNPEFFTQINKFSQTLQLHSKKSPAQANQRFFSF